MKNVTITLDDEVARWARIWAAEHETSVSRMVGEILRERMLDLRDYDNAMHAYRRRAPVALKAKRQRYPSRDQLHER